MKIRKNSIRGFFCVLLVLEILTKQLCVCAKERELNLYATSGVIIDGESHRVLYGKKENEIMPMASTTKIMTCILILENCELNDYAEVSAYAAGMPKVKLGVKKGEKYRIKDLLYSLMLESHNDSAVVLAEYAGKMIKEKQLQEKLESDTIEEKTIGKTEIKTANPESTEAVRLFVKMMNDTARKLGCCNTYFVTPNGLDAAENIVNEEGKEMIKEHGTTAYELAVIMSYCVLDSPKKSEFIQITQTKQYQFSCNNRKYFCNNHNLLFDMHSGVISGKTGFTNKAGYCYVCAVENEGRIYVISLLACGWPGNKNYKWKDALNLLKYGMDYYKRYNIFEKCNRVKKEALQPIEVVEGWKSGKGEKIYLETDIRYGGKEKIHMLLKEEEKPTVKILLPEKVRAPICEGEVIGRIQYLISDRVCCEDYVVAAENIDIWKFSYCFFEVLKTIGLLK